MTGLAYGWRVRAVAGAVVSALAGGACADDDDAKTIGGVRPSSFATNFALNADANGHRKWFAERGIAYHFIYTNEALRNLRGGLRRGSLFEGKLDAQLSVDLEKFASLPGWGFFGNVFQLHRTRGPRSDLTGSLITVSNIEARPTTRLSELWLEKKFWNGRMSLRAGQLAADQEFFIASLSEPFVNADWPAIAAANLPGGGPAYPLATPGVRLRYEPSGSLTLLTALFNGNPSPPSRDPETGNRHGVKFRLKDPPLWIGEAQWRYNQQKGLAGTLRLGAWRHFGRFDSLRLSMDGLSPPRPLGLAAGFRGKDGVYAIIDQQIYRLPGGGPESGVGLFARISKNMPAKGNPIDFYFDGGVLFSGMTPGRPADKFGATFIYAHMSKDLRRLDRDYALLRGEPRPLRSFELAIELSYQAQIMPGWTLQPVLQFIQRPGGGEPLPFAAAPRKRIGNAQIVGLRSIFLW